MRTLKEGLRQYVVREEIQNEYFKEVEYQVIHENALDILIDMQLRQKDKACSLLYDVTGAQSLEDAAEKKEFSSRDCMALLYALQELLQVMEEYMLEISHVDLTKENLYQMKDGSFRVCYCPDTSYDIEKDAEELFAWLLSRLNYQDHRGVRLIYHVYDLLRSQGFDQQTIEEALAYGENWREEYPMIAAENLMQEKEDAPQPAEIIVRKPQKERGIGLGFLILGLLTSLVFSGYWGSLILRYGVSVQLLQYLLGGLFFGLFFAFTLWGCAKSR